MIRYMSDRPLGVRRSWISVFDDFTFSGILEEMLF